MCGAIVGSGTGNYLSSSYTDCGKRSSKSNGATVSCDRGWDWVYVGAQYPPLPFRGRGETEGRGRRDGGAGEGSIIGCTGDRDGIAEHGSAGTQRAVFGTCGGGAAGDVTGVDDAHFT